MNVITKENLTLLNDTILFINRSELSNQSTDLNDSMSLDRYRMYILPTLPGWVSTFYLVLLCLTIGLGIPGNLITALAYFCVKNKSSCDWYIFFVALFDLVSCVFRVTGYLLEFLGFWVQLTNTSYCIFVGWVSQTSVCVSIFLFGLISIERYIKICCETKLDMTAERSKNICLVLTVITFIMGFPTVFMYTNTPNGVCSVAASATKKAWVKAYYCIIIALFIALTFAVIICYMAIIWTVRKRRKTVGVMADRTVPISMQNFTSQTVPGKGLSRQKCSEAETSQETTSSAHLNVPRLSSNGNRTPRLSVPKLFIVPGPQTTVIVQNVNTKTEAVTNKSVDATKTQNNQSEENKSDLNRSLPTPPLVTADSQCIASQSLNLFSQNQYAKRQRRDFKITGLLFLVTSIFIVSWIPPYYATVKAFFIGYTFPISTYEHITLKLAPTSYMINNFSNPIIYLALSSTYRQKLRYLWTKCMRLIKRPCSFCNR